MRSATLIALLVAACLALAIGGADATTASTAETCPAADLKAVIFSVASPGDCSPTQCRIKFPTLCQILPSYVSALYSPPPPALAPWQIALIALSSLLALLLATLLTCLVCPGCPLHDERLNTAPNVMVQVPEGSKVEMNEGVIKAIGPDGKPLEVVGVQGAGLNEIKIHPANRVA